jgi:3-hydroxybutyryl-CoA dehydrogenase
MDARHGADQAGAELQMIGATDLAIEAATENEETKKTIFKALSPHLGDNTLLASNTSSISITRLASATDRPDKFIGLHFMNPVPLMKLVEIIRGIATGPDLRDRRPSPSRWARPPPTPRTSRPSSSTASWCR